MPMYDFRCTKCEYEFELIIPHNQIENQACKCGAKAKRLYRYSNLVIDKTLGYYDIQLGAYIGSSSDKRAVMNSLGVTETPFRELKTSAKTVDKAQRLKEYTSTVEQAFRRNRGY